MAGKTLAAQIKETSPKRQTHADQGDKIKFLNEGGSCCSVFVFKQYKINNNKNQAAQDNSRGLEAREAGSAFSAT